MPKIYRWRFHVRTYDVGHDSKVRIPVYQNYCEESASLASASNGFSYDWYFSHQRVWAARITTLRYLTPVGYGDELEMGTWVSDYKRVQSHREYDLRRVSDGAPVLRARTNWVYLDSQTMRPQRLPDTFKEAFEPSGILDPIDTGLDDLLPVARPTFYKTEHRVLRHEIDSAGIANNAQYVGWAEQAITDMLRSLGWTDETFTQSSMTTLSHQIEYFQPARDNQSLVVETYP